MDDSKEIAMNDYLVMANPVYSSPAGTVRYGEYYNLTIGYAAIESAW